MMLNLDGGQVAGFIMLTLMMGLFFLLTALTLAGLVSLAYYLHSVWRRQPHKACAWRGHVPDPLNRNFCRICQTSFGEPMIHTTIKCDECKKTSPSSHSILVTKRLAREAGWYIKEDDHLCPKHRPRERR